MAKAKKTAKKKKAKVTAKTTAKKPAKTTAKAKSKATLHFDVSIEKVFEKMKAIVDHGKEAEFLQKCKTLKGHRFVTANARTVKLVKEFVAEHAQPPAASPGPHAAHPVEATAAVAAAAPAPADDETCFKHKN